MVGRFIDENQHYNCLYFKIIQLLYSSIFDFNHLTSCFQTRKIFFKNKFIYLFIFGCIGSSLLHAGFLSLWQVGLLFAAVCRLLIAVASLVAEHRL